MRSTRGFTILQLLGVVTGSAICFVILIAALDPPRRRGGCCQSKTSRELRGIHQSMVIFAQSNNTWLPGLDSEGIPLPNGTATGNSGNGDAAAARFWVLLNGQFIPGSMLINPQESLTAWSGGGTLTPAQYSFAALDISVERGGAQARWSEWRDNANSQAALMSDRNVGSSAADAAVRSLWTTTPGDWRGYLVWGDNHAGFEQSNRGFTTRYAGVTTTNDNLFASTASAGVTDNASDSGANALMRWP